MKDIYKLCVCIPLVGGEYVKEYDEIVDEVLINVHTSAVKREFPYIWPTDYGCCKDSQSEKWTSTGMFLVAALKL